MKSLLVSGVLRLGPAPAARGAREEPAGRLVSLPRLLVLAGLGRAEVALAAQALLCVALGLVFVTASFHPAHAGLVSREAVTLGRLADDSDVIALGRVEALADGAVTLRVETRLKRARGERLRFPTGRLRWTVGARRLCFLRYQPGGQELAAPASELHVLEADDAAAADELVAVVRGRLPRLGGDPAALRRALFAQLGSSLARVRQDAALELAEHRTLRPSPAARAALRAALSQHREEALLRLAAKLPEPALLAPVLASAELPSNRALAAEALQAIDPAAAATRLGATLRSAAEPDTAKAVAAAATLGHLPGRAALAELTPGLARPEAEVRAATIRALARRSDLGAGERAALEELVWRPRAGGEADLALGALAVSGSGAALRRVEAGHPDARLRRLATALRRQPVAAGRRLLRARRAPAAGGR